MPQFRGTLLGSFSLFFALGQLALAVGMKILNDANPMAFRNMFYSEFVFLALWIGPLIYIPESPGKFLTYFISVCLHGTDRDTQHGWPPRVDMMRPRRPSAGSSETSKDTTSNTNIL